MEGTSQVDIMKDIEDSYHAHDNFEKRAELFLQLFSEKHVTNEWNVAVNADHVLHHGLLFASFTVLDSTDSRRPEINHFFLFSSKKIAA